MTNEVQGEIVDLSVRLAEAGLGEESSAAQISAAVAKAGLSAAHGEFVGRMLSQEASGQAGGPGTAARVAFLILLLREGSATSQLVRRVASVAHRRMAGALEPYVDPDDFDSLALAKCFTFATRYFAPPRSIVEGNLAGFLAAVFKNMAIGEARRLAGRPVASAPDPLDVDIEDPRSEIEEFVAHDEIRVAAGLVARRHPDWPLDIAMQILLERSPRAEALAQINERRAAAGQAPWSSNALSSFLRRLRAELRASISE